jgi:threonine dehydratase
MKVAATRDYGAEIIFYDRHKEDREKFALELAERERLVMVPPYDDLLILAGQATCGVEFLEDVPDLDCLLAPCSGGGLFAGVATAATEMKSDIRCFPVEPDTADDTRQSLKKGERVSIPPPPTIADGLRVQIPGALTFPIVQKLAEDVLTVSDEEILETIRFMLFSMKVLVEPSGVAAAAAVMFRKLPADVQKVGVVLSGGNIDGSVLSRNCNVVSHTGSTARGTDYLTLRFQKLSRKETWRLVTEREGLGISAFLLNAHSRVESIQR